MDAKQIMQFFEDTAYVRTGGSPEELRAARYLRNRLLQLGLSAEIAPFEVPMAAMHRAVLEAEGVRIPCEGFLCSGSTEVEAPFYYLRDLDELSLSRCRGKIVMIDTIMRYWTYQDLIASGAVGFITYCGEVNYPDREIVQHELRSWVHKGNRIPGVTVNVKDAIELVRKNVSTVKISLQQEEYRGNSHNVILDMPGDVEEYIAFTAHYDSTPLSQGAYDNMSGSVGLVALAEHFSRHSHRYGLRFIWCGSEERGLLGAKEYCADEERLKNCVLNINLDMIGCIMGKFAACCTSEETLTEYLKYFAREEGFPIHAYQGVYSSDSTPFADKGVPAVSFARWAPKNTAVIHCSRDTMDLMSGDQMVEDIGFIIRFADRMANAHRCPVEKSIPDNMKEKLDEYLCRKRPAKK